MAFDPPRIFESLTGAWSFHRTITGHGTIDEGKAFFTPEGNATLVYRETGTLKMFTGTTLEVYQDYVYKLGERGISVYFKDGRFFHTVEPGEQEGQATGSHLCVKDFYEASYQFRGPKEFSLTWKVKGPKKDYVSQTSYRKRENGLDVK